MGPLFDAYVIVDWSAASTPKKGSDSIWYSVVEQPDLKEMAVENCPTRKEAFDDLCDILSDFQSRGLKIFIGFDFSFGYPKGFGEKLSLPDPSWKGVWREFSKRITDTDKNENNRFDVADEFNARLDGDGPFWGCPQKKSYEHLFPKKPKSDGLLAEMRLCEERTKGVKPVWQLLGTGCVGSQALMGISWLEKMRNHPWFQNDIEVWPFETGLKKLEREPLKAITVGEIYPSQIKLDLQEGDVKDQVQVSTMAKHYAELDSLGEFAELFAGDPTLTDDQKETVVNEEGWVLGVGRSSRDQALDWLGSYIKKPNDIYKKSEEMILEKLDLSSVEDSMKDVVIRMVHSVGDPSIIDDICYSQGAALKGLKALEKGKVIFTDVQMVVHGIIPKRLPKTNDVRCHLNDENTADLSKELGTTRSAAALENWGEDLKGSVVVIGNAPTALFHLLEGLRAKRFPKPALVIGCPVGFVGAAESKECLIEFADELKIPFITIRGMRGGSALAAAALNGLAKKGIVQ